MHRADVGSPPLRIGLLGCGRWGRNILRTLRELEATHPVRVTAVATTGRSENAQAVRELSGLECVRDVEAAIDACDAVVIATPDETHGALARSALAHGKHVLVEKPLASTAAEVDALFALAERAERHLTVGHLLVHHPGLALLRERLAGRTPRTIVSTRLQTFALRGAHTVLRSSLIHDIAMVDTLLPRVPTIVRVDAFPDRSRDPERIDVTLRYDPGVTVQLLGSSVWPRSERALVVWTDETCLWLDGGANELRAYRREGATWRPDGVEAPPGLALASELRNFIETVLGSARPLVTGDHVARVTRTIELIEAAA